MTKFIAPLAALALVGLAGCSGNDASNNADDNVTIETNLSSLDEPLANDTTLGNDAFLSNDSVPAVEAENATIVDPTLNATGNSL